MPNISDVHVLDALDKILFLDEPPSNAIADRDLEAFIGPVAVYIVHSPNRSFGAYAGAYRSPLSTSDVADVREWTQADVSGPFASKHVAMEAIKPAAPMSACYRFSVHRPRAIR